MDEKNSRPLDEDDITILKTFGLGPYSISMKKVEKDIKEKAKMINDLLGIKESDTGLAPTSQWDLASDKQMMQEEQRPLQVARCTEVISPNTDDAKYVIHAKQIAKRGLPGSGVLSRGRGGVRRPFLRPRGGRRPFPMTVLQPVRSGRARCAFALSGHRIRLPLSKECQLIIVGAQWAQTKIELIVDVIIKIIS